MSARPSPRPLKLLSPAQKIAHRDDDRRSAAELVLELLDAVRVVHRVLEAANLGEDRVAFLAHESALDRILVRFYRSHERTLSPVPRHLVEGSTAELELLRLRGRIS
jgi:hypothetical protein